MVTTIDENIRLIDQRNFLLRAVANGHKKEEDVEAEIKKLEKQIRLNTTEALKKEDAKLKATIHEKRHQIKTDGDLKRAIAVVLRDFLREQFDNDTIRGIFRQGYNLMRY